MATQKKKTKDKKPVRHARKSPATKTRTVKKSSPSQKGSSAKKSKKPHRKPASRALTVTVKTLDALNERLDIMLPEVMFRIAAIEHILVKNQLCSYEELVNARQFIQEQEAT